MRDNLASVLRLLLVTDDRLLAGRDPVAVCRAAVQGGVTAIQLRLKDASAADLASLGRALLVSLHVPLFVNDRLDVAIAIGAAGVHLGPDDVPVALARRVAPPGFIVGASVGSDDEVIDGADADYWGIGPWAATTTKADAGPALGAAGLSRIVARAGGRPCVAIGGIRAEGVRLALQSGATGIAVVSGILAAADVESAARRYDSELAQ